MISKTRITIHFSDEVEKKALCKLALKKKRTPDQQAVWIICQHLQRTGLLETPQQTIKTSVGVNNG